MHGCSVLLSRSPDVGRIMTTAAAVFAEKNTRANRRGKKKKNEKTHYYNIVIYYRFGPRRPRRWPTLGLRDFYTVLFFFSLEHSLVSICNLFFDRSQNIVHKQRYAAVRKFQWTKTDGKSFFSSVIKTYSDFGFLANIPTYNFPEIGAISSTRVSTLDE